VPVAEKKKRDYYEVLGVDRRANDVELKRAFRELARQYHPDVNPGRSAEERFKEANEAYAVLSDERARARYDRHGFSAVGGQPPSTGFQNVMDVVEDMFGDVWRRRQKKRRGRDLRYTLEVTLADVLDGCSCSVASGWPGRSGTARGRLRPVSSRLESSRPSSRRCS
jgi:molecular chaperone DnaJ